jgi:hypothetical protein
MKKVTTLLTIAALIGYKTMACVIPSVVVLPSRDTVDIVVTCTIVNTLCSSKIINELSLADTLISENAYKKLISYLRMMYGEHFIFDNGGIIKTIKIIKDIREHVNKYEKSIN